ncbi:DinB family protein [Lentzea sp. NPDC051213]|uniref:DinB family protein n=1 Tax=Lentzea sp. NPDC051213 TaxID=3364126 RepID=UPI0037AAA18A
MAEIQREPVPRVDTGELDVALAFLEFQRHCVLKKAEGLSDEQLRRPMVASGTSILWLIRHLAGCEREWFGRQFAGGEPAEESEPADPPAAEVIAEYRAAIVASDRIIRDAGDPEALTAILIDGVRKTLRWVLAHMTTETARHAGHADIIREQIDGATGR